MFTKVFALSHELARPVACGWLSQRNARFQLLAACLRQWRLAGDNTRDPFAAHKFACWLMAEKMKRLAAERDLALYRLEQTVWQMSRLGAERTAIYAAVQHRAAQDGWLNPNQAGDLVADTLEAAARWQRKQRKRPQGKQP